MVNLVVFIILIIGITSHYAHSSDRPMFAFQVRNKCRSISPDYVNPYENRPTLCEFFSIVDRIGQTILLIKQKANVKIEPRAGVSMCSTLFPETRFLFPHLKEKICALFRTFRVFPILCRKKERPEVSTPSEASPADTEPPTTYTIVPGEVSFPSALTSTWSPSTTTGVTEPPSTQTSTVAEGALFSSTTPTLGTTEVTTIITVTKPSTLPTTPEALKTDGTTAISPTESTFATSTILSTSIPDSPTTTPATSNTPSEETDPMSESTPTEEPPSSELTMAATIPDSPTTTPDTSNTPSEETDPMSESTPTEEPPSSELTMAATIPDSPTTTPATSNTPSEETDPLLESTPTEESPSSESTMAATIEDRTDASSSPEELSSITSGTFYPPTEPDFFETVPPDGRTSLLSQRLSNFLNQGQNPLDLHSMKLWLFSPQRYLNGAIKHIFNKFGDDALPLLYYRRELESFQMNLTNGNFPETEEEKRIARSLADKIEKDRHSFDAKLRETHRRVQKSYNRVNSRPTKDYMREILKLLELADDLPELAICSLVNKRCPTGLITVFVH